MSRNKIHWLFAFLLFQLFSAVGIAGIIPMHQRLQNSISTSGKDTLWTEITPKTGSFKDVKVSDMVTVGIDPDYPKYIRDSSVFVITLTIDGYSAANTLISSTSHTFTITHALFNKMAARDKDIYLFNNAYKYRVKFTSATKNGTSVSTLPDYIYIDADIEIERYYNFSAYATSTFTLNTATALNIDCDGSSIPDELRVSWNTGFSSGTVIPESYDLEWTFVNDYDTVVGAYKSNSLVKFDFKGNSTRVSLTDNSYKISLVYEHGYLIYRVRGIGRDTAHPSNNIVGVWSIVDNGTVSSLSSANYYHVTLPHEKGKNWQYNSSFAEEGKKKEVVSYYDGSLRNRQSVTKMNSDKNTLIGETIYDHQGRPAINVLPAPVDFPTCTDSSEGAIKFYPNFNRDDAANAYTRNDFDIDSTGSPCTSNINPMSTGYGSSHYYSPNNPNKTGHQAFVPDAKKYPFTQVEYTPDNTGRIKRQGGVGINHQLNTGHETKFFYGQPSQIQLNRMFGSEAGDASHYKKNVTVDANGQSSITYVDQEGRTIATSLAGDSAIGLKKLSSNTSPVVLTSDLFNKNALGKSKLDTVNSSGNALEFNTQLLSSYPGSYKFSYSLSIDTMYDACLRSSICFNCVYDLEMHIYNDCGVDLLAQHLGDTLKKTIGHFRKNSDSTISFKDTCSGSSHLTERDTFSLFLAAGNYTVSKVLKINQNAVNFYVAKYLDTTYNSCVKSLSTFVNAAVAAVDTSDCHITCASCLKKLGDRDAFVANGKGTYLDFDALADACQEPCKAKSECYVKYVQMVSDMSPNGQYGEYLDHSNNINPSSFPLSVYNASNSLPKNISSGTANRHNPHTVLNNTTYNYFLEDNGNISTINVSLVGGVYTPSVVSTSTTNVKYDSTTFSYYTYPSNLAKDSDFFYYWKPSWAKGLVSYHPEYCYYENCAGFGNQASNDFTTSDAFDALLRTTNTFSLAVANGLIKSNYNSLAYNVRVGDYHTRNASLPYDPFLLNNPKGGTLYGLLSNYSPRPISGKTISMCEAAAYYTRCGTLFSNTDTTGCVGFGTTASDSIKNQEWQTFVGLYLSNKQTLQQQYLDSVVKSGACSGFGGYNGCIGNSSYNGFYSLGFYTFLHDHTQPCSFSTYSLYTNKIKRFGDAISTLGTSVNTGSYEMYLATGQCPMATDLQNLLNQIAINKKLKSGSSVALHNYSTFTPDIYTVLGGVPGHTTHYKQFYWNSSTSVDSISASFKDSTGATVCSLKIDLTSSGLSSLTGYVVAAVSGLTDTTFSSHPNAFRVWLALKDTVADTVIYRKALGYSTCFNITACKFQQTCTPSDFANDLQNLMSGLALNHKLGASSVSLDQTLYAPYVTAPLKNQISSTASNKLIWNYNNTAKNFELYDSLKPSIKLLINLGGDTAQIKTKYSINHFNSIYSFYNVNSSYYNYFTIAAMDSVDGNRTMTVASIEKRTIISADTTIAGVSMGSCGYPTSFNCVGSQYKLQNDLQLLIHDALTTMPTSHNVDLTDLPSYSYLLSNSFPLNLDTTTSVIKTHVSGWGKYKTQLLFTVKSSIDSCYLSLNADTLHAFDSIVDFYSLKGYGSTDGNGNYHQFYGMAKYKLHSGTFTDTIFGQSCLPILNCCACATTDTLAANTTAPVDTCHTLYNQLKTAITAFNTAHGGTSISINPNAVSYYDVTHFGFCNCISSYIAYINTYTAAVSPPTLLTYTACPGNNFNSDADKVCEDYFVYYKSFAHTYDAYIVAHSISLPKIDTTSYTAFSFNASGFCTCVPAYLAFIKSISDGITAVSSVDTNMLNITKYCQSNFQPPCVTYVKPDTGITNGIPNIIVTIPPDSSCAKYALNLAVQNGTNQYNQYRDSLTTIIATKYVQHCLAAEEDFIDKYQDKEYHHTLYYYDQAGNLIRTIPPEGVNLVNVTDTASVPLTTRANAADSICYDLTYNTHTFFTNHTMPTAYLYNSLNQLVKQSLPDHDPINIWEYALPLGLDNRLQVTGVQFVNENTGYLTGYVILKDSIKPGIGKRGYIYSTSDGGKSWLPMQDVVASYLNKVQGLSNNKFIAVGKQGIILKTDNGGYTWDVVPSLQKYAGSWGIAPDWNDAFFKDSIHGIIVGSNGKSLLVDLSKANPINCIDTASLPNHYSDTLTGVTFDGSVAYASAVSYDNYGYLYKTTTNPFTSGTLVWRRITGIPANNLLGIQFLKSDSIGFICGVNGTLVKTKNGGVTWGTVRSGLTNDIQKIFFRNDSVGFALVDSSAGKTKLYKTSSGGNSWTLLSSPGKYYKDVSFYTCSNASTKDKAFAVGKSGLINRVIASTNTTAPYFGTGFGLGTLNAPTDKIDFNAVAAATYTITGPTDKPKVIVGGSNGKAYFSQKADSTYLVWDSVTVASAPIKKIALGLTSTHYMQAVAIDTGGTIYGIDVKTKTISTVSVGTQKFSDVVYKNSAFYAFNNYNKTPYKIIFPDSTITATAKNADTYINKARAITFTGNHLIVAGDSGDIYKDTLLAATSGTLAWKNYSAALKFAPLRDVQADSSSRTTPAVYAVGDNGLLLQKKSSDTTWKKIIVTSTRRFNAIKFYNRFKGVIAADGGKLYLVGTSPSVTITTINTPTTVTTRQNDVSINTSIKEVISAGNGGSAIVIPDITAGTLTPLKLNLGAVSTDLNGVLVGGPSSGTTHGCLFVGAGNSIYGVIHTDSSTSITTQTIMRVGQIYTQGLTRAHFTDVNNGYVVGENGFIRHTNDGQNWKIVLPNLSTTPLRNLNSVYTYQDDKAVVVGAHGYMAKINGTTAPSSITSGTTHNLNDIQFEADSTNKAYIVGDSITALKLTLPSTVQAYSVPSFTFASMYHLKSLHVFLDHSFITVGTKGTVAFYNAPAHTWYQHDPPYIPSTSNIQRYNFNDVYFTDDRNGYVVGDSGVAMRWSSTANIQRINVSSHPASSNFKPKPTKDNLGVTDSTKINIKCIAMNNSYEGFMGGAFPDTSYTHNNPDYARLFHDESQQFSTFFWYDQLGRMVVSQNSKQFASNPKKYSYTLYDNLGRITEVGEKPDTAKKFNGIFYLQGSSSQLALTTNTNNQIYYPFFSQWVKRGYHTQVTRTYYDSTVFNYLPLTQQNLRKRVSSVTYADTVVYDSLTTPYNHATHYTYDIHGNVNTLVQDNPSLDVLKQRYKKIDYDYDLISGKVNDVYYQNDSLDAFTHHYEYDADNRITNVYTSHYQKAKWPGHKDNTWDNDAKYFYYAHGPLARVEYGDNHVQGVDYYYTIQGWIKGVNSNILNPHNDGGTDGLKTTVNANFAKDAYGYTLGYFAGDYSPIDTSKWNTVTKRFEANTASSSLSGARYNLYNGNIGHMVTTIIQPDTNYASQTILPQGTAYKYDQLNRLIEMKAFINITNNAFGTTTYNGRYNNRFTYDANGNILTQVRKNQAGATFDSLTYRYNKDSQGRKSQNRLYHVNDTITASVMSDDIDNEGVFNSNVNTINTVNNYNYDKIGNLVKDSAEGIAKIDWTVYGKIKSITHRTGYYKMSGADTMRPPDLVFNYDAAGNRISKTNKPRTATGVKGSNYWTSQYYVRDAQGNILSTYNQRDSVAISTAYFTQTEKHIYGSSRIGIDNTYKQLLGATFSTDTSNRYLGHKSYELTNHLGNVLTTISDKRIPVDSNHNDTTDFYVADIRSATDYASFGAPLDGRTFNAGASVNGFNNQRKDDDIDGAGNTNTAEFWEYDTRLGHRWNIDPLAKPWQGYYTCYSANPIMNSDLSGDFDASAIAGVGINGSDESRPQSGIRTMEHRASDPTGGMTHADYKGGSVNYRDPTVQMVGSNPPSTHIDENGNVIRKYDDGDNSVYVHKNGTTTNDVDKQYGASMKDNNTSAGGNKIGELGGTIDVNNVFKNVLNDHRAQSADLDQKDWFMKVKQGGEWDLKNNESTIFGVAWHYDLAQEDKIGSTTKTSFSYKGFKLTAADVGNYHAGYMGTLMGVPKFAQKMGAGVVETLKQRTFLNSLFFTNDFMSPPYGDQKADYHWNTKGMEDAGQKMGKNTCIYDADELK